MSGKRPLDPFSQLGTSHSYHEGALDNFAACRDDGAWIPPPREASTSTTIMPPPTSCSTSPGAALLPPPGQHNIYTDPSTTQPPWPPWMPSKKSTTEAYILALSPFGLLGAHHFYLRRYGWGMLYFFTFGIFGIGYVGDWFRVPFLVRSANSKTLMRATRGFNPEVEKMANLRDAYTLWFPLGLLGFHHYYLGNYILGFFYTITLGFFGLGWIVDAFRLPSLVRSANERVVNGSVVRKSLAFSYFLGVTPLGVLGAHHYYMSNPIWGVIYTFTFGLMGVGYVVDLFRMPWLVRRANAKLNKEYVKPYHVDEAYVLWMPFGLLGYHHFYLGRLGWGFFYKFTLGIFGIGWLIDLCRIPHLVKEANRRAEERRSGFTGRTPNVTSSIIPNPNNNAGNLSNANATNNNNYQSTVSAVVYPGSSFNQPVPVPGGAMYPPGQMGNPPYPGQFQYQYGQQPHGHGAQGVYQGPPHPHPHGTYNTSVAGGLYPPHTATSYPYGGIPQMQNTQPNPQQPYLYTGVQQGQQADQPQSETGSQLPAYSEYPGQNEQYQYEQPPPSYEQIGRESNTNQGDQ